MATCLSEGSPGFALEVSVAAEIRSLRFILRRILLFFATYKKRQYFARFLNIGIVLMYNKVSIYGTTFRIVMLLLAVLTAVSAQAAFSLVHKTGIYDALQDNGMQSVHTVRLQGFIDTNLMNQRKLCLSRQGC